MQTSTKSLLLQALATLLTSLLLVGAVFGQQVSLPKPNKTVVVFEENRSFSQIIGSKQAPYINELASKGALFTRAYGITHPSQPNYLAFFSGSPNGVSGDACATKPIRRENLGSLLLAKFGVSGFATFSESLPTVGYTGCSAAHGYARKHNPMVNWQGTGFPGALPASFNRPLDAFPKDFSNLPAVSFVVPNLRNDMHDGAPAQAISRGDTWLREHIVRYVEWAQQNNSLLIVVWDEDDYRGDNRIPAIFVGPMVKSGVKFDEKVDHYDFLRTILGLYELAAIDDAKSRNPITGVWVTDK